MRFHREPKKCTNYIELLLLLQLQLLNVALYCISLHCIVLCSCAALHNTAAVVDTASGIFVAIYPVSTVPEGKGGEGDVAVVLLVSQ